MALLKTFEKEMPRCYGNPSRLKRLGLEDCVVCREKLKCRMEEEKKQVMTYLSGQAKKAISH